MADQTFAGIASRVAKDTQWLSIPSLRAMVAPVAGTFEGAIVPKYSSRFALSFDDRVTFDVASSRSIDILSASSLERQEIGEIELSLHDPALVAALVLGTNQLVGRTTAFGAHRDVGLGTGDFGLDMGANLLDGLECPALAAGIREEPAELRAMCASAADGVWPDPILGRFKRQGDTRVKMGNRGGVQGSGRRASCALGNNETLDIGNKEFVGVEVLRPRQHMGRCALG